MIDFNKAQKLINIYSGTELKQTVLYNGVQYMLKFPDPVSDKKIKNLDGISYKNNQFSEHIGSSVFRACGFDAQKTLLGYCDNNHGKQKIVVACEDFTQDGSKLHQFSVLKNQIIVDRPKFRESIEDVYNLIENMPYLKNKGEIVKGFWDMFVIDALIGNRDRHLGNWGLLEKNGELKLAPIYDCGSSLSAMIDDASMETSIKSSSDFRNLEFNINSCYSFNGKKVVYHEIFKKPPTELAQAIKRITPRIDMQKINALINDTPKMSEVRKSYLIKSLELRYNEIIAPAHRRILKAERATETPPKTKQPPQKQEAKQSFKEQMAQAKQAAKIHNERNQNEPKKEVKRDNESR